MRFDIGVEYARGVPRRRETTRGAPFRAGPRVGSLFTGGDDCSLCTRANGEGVIERAERRVKSRIWRRDLNLGKVSGLGDTLKQWQFGCWRR